MNPVVKAALIAFGVNAAFLRFIDLRVLSGLGVHAVTLLVLSFGSSAFIAAAVGGSQKGRMLTAVFVATVFGMVGSVADDPTGAVAGLILVPMAGAIPATLGAVAGLTVDRHRNGPPLSTLQVVGMCAPAIVLLVGALAFPELLTPTLEF